MSLPEVRQMRSEEVLEAIEAGRVPVVPVATLETHDPHLPVDVDVVCAEEVALRAARERPDLVLAFPPVAYGYTEHTLDFPGGYSIRPEVLLEFYYDIGESIVQNGFRKLLFLNGHGSNVTIMNLASRLVTLRTPGLCAATSWWDLCRESRARLRESEFPGGMAHACEFETSAYMHLRPDAVRHDLVEDCISTMNNEWTYSDTDGFGPIHLVPWWSQTSANGTEGRPSLASAEKGEAMVDEAVANLIRFCEFFRAFEEPPLRDRRPEHLRWIPARR
jgi:creatinine amidohydrolase